MATNPTPEAPPKLLPLRYSTPEMKGSRAVSKLVINKSMVSVVQIFGKGAGELEKHAHTGMDGIWFVLKGRARFYGDDELPIEIGVHEGVYVPRNAPYWFDNPGDEPLELLQVEAIDPTVPNNFVRIRANDAPKRIETFTADGQFIEETIVDRKGLGDFSFDYS